MKTSRLFALFTGIFISAASAATAPATTYTFVNPCQPFAAIAPIPNTYGCFSYTATNAGAVDPNGYFSWNFGDGATATGTQLYHCYPPSTVTVIYTVTVYYNSSTNCGSFVNYQTYTLAVNPPADNGCVTGPLSITQAPPSVTVDAFPAIPETVFNYNFGDGTPTTATTNVHTYTACGSYIIHLSYWDMNQPEKVCDAYAAVNFPCAPTPTVVGVEERKASASPVQVFPNPASDVLQFRSGLAIVHLNITDITGREWNVSERVNGNTHTIDIAELPPGVYFLKLKPEQGTGINTKFIKR
jgi:hypothetical protein